MAESSFGCFSCKCCLPDKSEFVSENPQNYDSIENHTDQTKNQETESKLNNISEFQTQETQGPLLNKNLTQIIIDQNEGSQIENFIQISSKKATIQKISSILGRKAPELESPVLNLEIIESKEFNQQEQFIIYPWGYPQSKRGVKDGVTIFGTHNHLSQENDEIKISTADVVVTSGQHGFGKKHFAIFFDTDVNQYKVVDLYQGSGTFFLLSNPIHIQNKMVVSFGISHITFEISKDQKLKVIFLSGPLNGQQYQFESSQGVVKIGRHSGSDIKVPENGLSRTQCILFFESTGWTLKDGDEQKMSTNGTWLFTGEPQTLFNSSILKVAKTIFKMHIA